MRNKKKLGEILIELGLLDEKSLGTVLEKQKQVPKKRGEILLEMKLLRPEDLIKGLARQCDLPYVDKLPETPDPKLGKIIPIEFMERYQIIPYELKGDRLKVGTINPQSLLFIDNLTLSAKLNIDLVFTSPEEINRLLAYFDRSRAYFQETKPKDKDKKKEGEEKSALIDMVEYLVAEAMRQRASDIHLEVAREDFKVRYRVDGLLKPIEAPPKELSPQVISRVKVMAGLDLAEKHVPQDGRIRFHTADQRVDLRVSILPSLHGESVVMRILQGRNLRLGLSHLGLSEEHYETFKQLISLPHGMIFITGPTGSGKTTSLYAALETLNTPGEKIITVEDPIEYELDGINQVQIKPEIGLTFAKTLRSMLRQAPTIILVGEIRDLETAEIAVQAALTGHLVFSTLHTNDALSAIPRLIDLGIKPYLVAAATQGVLAQRLVRKICTGCKEPIEDDASLEAFFQRRNLKKHSSTFYRGAGCKECNYTGYRGRVAIYEMVPLDEELRIMISKEGGSIESLRKLAKQKRLEPLITDGLDKAQKGITTLEEVLRVAEMEEEYESA